MKYKSLRWLIKRLVEPKKFVLRNSKLVVDARSFRGEAYQKSGCQFLLGGEMDRFASYLRRTLQKFKENNVTAYFIFKGGRCVEEERRISIYQKLTDEAAALDPKNESSYCDPPFVKEVFFEVLDELGIKWFVAEYDMTESLLSVARSFNWPVLTNNLELCLYGISCVSKQSIASDTNTGNITFDIYEADACKRAFSIKDLMPLFLTLADEDGKMFEKIPEITPCKHAVPALFKWIRRQSKNDVLHVMKKKLHNEADRKAFMKSSEEHEKLYRNDLCQDAVKYFENENKIELHENDPRWFAKGVSDARITVAYINLYYHRILSGSWLVADESKEDAMLPAMEIIKYANGLLTNFRSTKITFFGRKGDKCCPWEIEFNYEPNMSNTEFFNNSTNQEPRDFFHDFIMKVMPALNYELLLMLDVPEDCWILMMTSVYYYLNHHDICLVYSFLLSYVMLGPVSAKIGVIKRSNFELNHNEVEEIRDSPYGLSAQECTTAAQKLMPLFEIDEYTKSKYDRGILHSFSEFQHCLHHMNHLNKLCGEKIKCTAYHKTINATFAFNAYQKMKDESRSPLKFYETHLKNSAVLEFFVKLVGSFDQLLMIQKINVNY